MIIIYGSNNTRSHRALWALEEAGIAYEYKQVRLGRRGKDGAKADEYLQLNPQGKVPTLVDDGFVITESAAILNYIAALAPERKLIPLDDIKLRARYDQVCFLVLSELEQPLWTSAKHRFALPKKLRLAEIGKTAQWEFARAVSAIDILIGGKQYAINDHFTMADILISQTLMWADRNSFEVPDNLLSYSKAMYERTACQQALQAQQADE